MVDGEREGEGRTEEIDDSFVHGLKEDEKVLDEHAESQDVELFFQIIKVELPQQIPQHTLSQYRRERRANLGTKQRINNALHNPRLPQQTLLNRHDPELAPHYRLTPRNTPTSSSKFTTVAVPVIFDDGNTMIPIGLGLDSDGIVF